MQTKTYFTKRMFGLGKKTFCMSVYHHIKQLVVQEFFPNKVWFSWKTTKIDFFCFYRVTKTHQDKIAA